MDLSRIVLSSLLVCMCLHLVSSNVIRAELNVANKALMYLNRYGYIDPSALKPHNSNSSNPAGLMDVRNSILEFQAFAGLNQTGVLDEDTMLKMEAPRCGVRDKVGYGSNARKKRYALQGSRWKVRELNYRITKYPTRLSKGETDKDILKAFKVWSDVTDLTFKRWTSGKVHIEIRFERDEHGDGDPFDGAGGTLAHAYFPIYGGDAHFDDREIWTVNSYRGTNLLQVAAHEFGHSLGLSHSDDQSALMAPFYKGYEPVVTLDQDDITGIESLYGKKTYKAAPPSATPRPSYGAKPRVFSSVLCKDSSFDAMVTMGNKKTYVFKGAQFWMLTNDGIAEKYPKRIPTHFHGLPHNLDAAFTWTNNKTYFFKGSEYWRFNNFEMDVDYPKKMSAGFMGIPNDVDAAFVWSGNGKIYFFKGANYYKFDPEKRPPVAEKYPKDISIWEGLPYNMDDALQYVNGYTYFFKNGKYWRFNDRSFKVDSASPEFPRAVGPWWFGCEESGSMITANATGPGTASGVADDGMDYNEIHSHRDPPLYPDDEYYTDDDYSLSSGMQDTRHPISNANKSTASAFKFTNFTYLLILPVLFTIASIA